jgi:hypothetical protein
MNCGSPASTTTRAVLALILLVLAAPRAGAEEPAWDTWSDTWTAADSLGRIVAGPRQAGPPRPDRCVGIFYFLWHGAHHTDGPYDISKILAQKPGQRAWGAHGKFHYWSEPLFGYYLAHDQAVLRKHAQMLADAGIDVLIIDATNGFTYLDNVRMLSEVLLERRSLGMRAPRIAFFANGAAARELFAKVYGEGRPADAGFKGPVPPELWFRWQDKPLLLAVSRDAGDLPVPLREFFTIRKTWGLEPIDEPNEWSFLQYHPQDAGMTPGSDAPEFMSVSVAQQKGYFSDGVDDRGRSFHGGRQPPPLQTDERGHNFSEQWLRALFAGPKFVFVTGWNEWVAQRKGEGDEALFVDTYSKEFSRDIEPMNGGHGDNYYLQLVSMVRSFKGVRPQPAIQPRPIAIDGRFDDWKEVAPEFRDDIGDPVNRDSAGWGTAGPYVDKTGRNDIVAAKVSYDAENLYFHVRTREALTPSSDMSWMMLFIDADRNDKTGWLGYDFVVNRAARKKDAARIENCSGRSFEWLDAGYVAFRAAGSEMEIGVPRDLLGLMSPSASFDFKWADNLPQTGDATDFTLHGDAAPNDRFNYRAILAEQASTAGRPAGPAGPTLAAPSFPR